jgi:translocator protein
MKTMKWLPIANVIAYILTLVMNGVSQAPGLFPQTVGQLGESRAIFFLPAGYVFSIWGVIYLGLGAYVVYQALPKQANNPLIGQISFWFILSSIGNVTWLLLFLGNQVLLSTIAMLVILGSLIRIYLALGIGRKAVSRAEYWFVHTPFSIYLGWITVATVANFAAMLYTQNFVTSFIGIGADIWAVVMMAVAAIVAGAMLIRHRDVAYALVVVWALVGIYARPFTTATFAPLAGQNIGLVDSGALVIAVAVGLGALWALIQRFRAPMALAS